MKSSFLRHLVFFLRHPLWRARRVHFLGRCLRRAALGVLLLLSAAVLAFKLWLPELTARKGELEAFLTERAGRPVRIQALDSYWEGFSPHLRARGVAVLSADGRRRALGLEAAHLRLALLPLLAGRVVFHDLTLVGPALRVVRDRDGRIRVADLAGGDGGRATDAAVFLEWLWRQNRIRITQGRLRWEDRLAGEPPLELRDVHIRLAAEGEGHRLTGGLRLPETLCRDLRLEAEFEGAPGVDEDWRGRVGIRVSALRLEALPAVLRERLPEGLAGTVDLDGRLLWAGGGPREARGRLSVAGAAARLPGLAGPLRLDRLAGGFLWRRRDEGWRLEVDGTELVAGQGAWQAGRLVLERDGGETRLALERLGIDALADFLAGLPGQARPLEVLRALAPRGELHGLRVALRAGPGGGLAGYRVQARLARGAVSPYRKLPGLRGLAGELELDQAGGRFRLRATNGEIDLPRFFDAPIPIALAEGTVRWQRAGDHWRVRSDDLRLANGDGRASASFRLRVPRDRSRSPILDLEARLENGDLAAARRYVPVRRLKPKTTAWLERAFVAGRVAEARVRYLGPVRRFPAPEAEVFRVQGRVLGGVVDYAPGWPRVEAPRAEVLIDRGALWVSADRARLHGLEAEQVSVRVNDLRDPDKVVAVRGRLAGPVARALDFLQTGPLFKEARPALGRLRAAGHGQLELSVDVVPRHGERSRVQGRYRVRDGTLRVGEGVEISGIDGLIEFDQGSVRAAPLAVRVLGGPAVLAVETPRPGRHPEVVVRGQGRLAAKRLEGLLGPALTEPLAGEADWRGRLRIGREGAHLELSSDLRGVSSSAPPPLAKEPGEAWPLALSADFRRRGRELRFRAGDRLAGLLVYGRDGRAPERGQVVVGDRPPQRPQAAGLGLVLHQVRLDLDRWVDYLRPRLPGPGEPAPVILERLAGQVGQVRYLDRSFHDLRFQARRPAPERWEGEIRARELAGRVAFQRSEGQSRVALDLDHLYWHREEGDGGPPPVRERLPELEVTARDFRYGAMRLGRLELHALPDPRGWRVQQFQVARPHMRLSASGLWRLAPGSESSRFQLNFATSDAGRALEDLAVPQRVEGGRATLEADLAWPGGPGDFRLARVQGRLDLDARDGRFPQLDPGAGRLFGLFNLDALTRRLRLDFSDVFKKGFVFDRITGRIRLQGGSAYTRDLRLVGPTADIWVVGRSGILAEDYDLELTVSPHLGGNLAVAGGVLGSPATGAALFLFQKVFKKQLAGLVRYRYLVTGPWRAPSMTRLEGRSRG